jgi:hypothetical protein
MFSGTFVTRPISARSDLLAYLRSIHPVSMYDCGHHWLGMRCSGVRKNYTVGNGTNYG